MEVKLVDQLGDEKEALAWLTKEKKIDPALRVRDYQLEDRLSDLSFLHLAAITLLDAVGLRSFAQQLETSGTVQSIERLNLDGLLTLWHPSTTN